MSPLARHLDELYATATAIEEFLDETAGELPYEDWDSLNEAAVQIRAYASLIHSQARDSFVEGELGYAKQLLQEARHATAGGD